MKHIVILDGYNLMHRARSGFLHGDYAIVFNFFRSLKALLANFDIEPDRVIFTLEGEPKARLEFFPEYKANREIDENDEKKRIELEHFHHQKDIIIELLQKYFPIAVMKHPDYEADDLIYTIVNRGSRSVKYTVVSNDTDFIQMLNEFDNVSLYNPMKKAYVEKPLFDYVTWKALKGDSCDNIPGIPGIGEKTATKLSTDPDLLTETLSDPLVAKTFSRNVNLIKLHSITADELVNTESSVPVKDWKKVQARFNEFDFKSMLKDPYWTKFRDVFDKLWGAK